MYIYIIYLLCLFHILKMINATAIMIPNEDIVPMQINKGNETVLRTVFTMVLSCGTLPPIHLSMFLHVKLSLCVS